MNRDKQPLAKSPTPTLTEPYHHHFDLIDCELLCKNVSEKIQRLKQKNKKFSLICHLSHLYGNLLTG